VTLVRLVRHDYETGLRMGAPDDGIRLEKHRFVLGPRRARYQCGSTAAKLEQMVDWSAALNLIEDTVESGITQNSYTLSCYSKSGQP
jgi:hypothetical protein